MKEKMVPVVRCDIYGKMIPYDRIKEHRRTHREEGCDCL